MNPEEFSKKLEKKAQEVRQYSNSRFPSVAGDIALRFINGNFRAGGWQGSTFKKWKKSPSKTTLVNTGRLRSANYYTTQPGEVTLHNSMPYAKIHNEGYKGQVSVKAYTRNTYTTAREGTGKFTAKGKERTKKVTRKKGDHQVRAHTRSVNIEARQFIPTGQSPSAILNNGISREVMRDLTKIIE